MADIYGSLAGATAYHSDRDNNVWADGAYTDAMRSAALLRASEALDGQYGARFPGKKAGGRAQERAWPRIDAIDHCQHEAIPDDEVPVGVAKATYEIALAELQAPGSWNPSFIAGEINKRERVEGAVEVERFGPSDGVAFGLDAMRPLRARVVDFLACLMTEDTSGGGTFWVNRA